jgi:hypothetical protein
VAGFTKLFSDIIDSTIWREDHATKIVWVTMLAKADRHGVVRSSLPGLADAARVTIPECESAIQKFLGPDPYSRTKDLDGRRILETDGGWILLNYLKYRKIRDDEETRIATAERVRRFREKQNVTRVTPGNAIAEAEAEAEAEAKAKAEAKDQQTMPAETSSPPARVSRNKPKKEAPSPEPVETLETILHGSKDAPSRRWLGFWALHALFGQEKNRAPKTTAQLYVHALSQPGVTIESIHERAAALVSQVSERRFLPSMLKWFTEEGYLVPLTPGASRASKSPAHRAAADAAYDPRTNLRSADGAAAAPSGNPHLLSTYGG